MSNSKQVVYEIEVTEHNEFGQCLKAVCPDCHQEIRQLEAMHSWNVLVCQCPKEWSFVIQAVGIPTMRAGGFAARRVKNKGSVKAANR